MARVALYSIIAVALVTGVVFAANPRLEFEVAGFFFRPDVRPAVHDLQPVLEVIRACNNVLAVTTVLLALGGARIQVDLAAGPSVDSGARCAAYRRHVRARPGVARQRHP